jgi:hypothetical protein
VRDLAGAGGVVAALSVTSDLTRGHPPGEAMRACLLATELASRAGLDPARQGEVYYGTLLRFVGCAATSHEIAAALGGDDVAVRVSMTMHHYWRLRDGKVTYFLGSEDTG